MLDLRVPIGTFFLLNGILLVAAWLVGMSPHDPLTSVAVNLWVGLPMVLFGGLLLAMVRRDKP